MQQIRREKAPNLPSQECSGRMYQIRGTTQIQCAKYAHPQASNKALAFNAASAADPTSKQNVSGQRLRDELYT